MSHNILPTKQKGVYTIENTHDIDMKIKLDV